MIKNMKKNIENTKKVPVVSMSILWILFIAYICIEKNLAWVLVPAATSMVVGFMLGYKIALMVIDLEIAELEKDGPKKTMFDSDECQALLDLCDKMKETIYQCLNSFDLPMTKEERSVYKKLQKAGEFYVPNGGVGS